MAPTDRMLMGAIAGNPSNHAGSGEYRYSVTHQEIYFSSSTSPDPKDSDRWIPLPSLNPDGSKRMERAFKHFVKRRWLPSRQHELEDFALKRGWDLAMELKYGGGALEDNEAEEWQHVVNRELERLTRQAREAIDQAEPS
ncbi:MAG: hypothetical protein HC884_07425 [Chloroflexaceae bacterium]|nr:hypothetical protein [Chloroflexaceae bacterium]